jgi:hypothetical protein
MVTRQQPFLIFGTVTDSLSNAVSNANVEIRRPSGIVGSTTTNSAGRFVYDLASIGYNDGEVITVITTGEFNDYVSTDTFNVVQSAGSIELSISLTLRTSSIDSTGYSPQSILHTVGKKPVTRDNPLPIIDVSAIDGGIVFGNYSDVYAVTRVDLQPDSITRTAEDGRVYRQTFTYNAQGAVTAKSRWVIQ